MRFSAMIILLFAFSVNAYAQTYEVSGRIIDSKSNKGLEFAAVRLGGTDAGTTSDGEGNYILRLKPGGHTLIVSYIGYNSDTASVFVDDANTVRDIYLSPSELLTESIDVFGEDPAYEIMRKVISYKKKFREKLSEYEYDAYSKFVIRSNRGSVNEEQTKEDDKLGIFGILESESTGYFRKPDQEKQVVKSKRETANIVRGVALPFFLNFYDDKVDVGEFKIKTPVADDAFDSYDYKLMSTTSMDSLRIFKINVINTSEVTPLLKGTIYVADSIFSVLRVNLSSNSAANPRLVDSIEFQQKFSPFKDKKSGFTYWMPTDIQIYAGGSFAGIATFTAEVFSVISEYRLNKKAPAGVFDEFVIKVMPDAGKKDSSYWNRNRKMRETGEEVKAFSEIERKEKREAKSLNFGIASVSYGKSLSTYPLTYYRYNRVEGSALRFGLDYTGKIRSNTVNAFAQYGFSDEKFKYGLSFAQRLIEGWRLQLGGEVYDKLSTISYGEVPSFDIFINSMTGLFDKTDSYDYYYASGFRLNAGYWLIPQLNIGAEYLNEDQRSAVISTNYSFRKSNVEFSRNPPVNEGVLRTLGASFRLNLNEYGGIDWGDGDISIFREGAIPVLDAGFIYSGKNFLSSSFEYRKFYAKLSGNNYINKIFRLNYELGGIMANGEVPYQSLGFLNSRTGNINMGRNFGNTHINEFPGDKVYYLTIRNNFGNTLWREIPVLKSVSLSGYVNFMRNEISDANKDFSAYNGFRISEGIYTEAGFKLGNIFDLLDLSFTWRVNNRFEDARNFYLTLTSVRF